jgi:hypothetical protein
MVGAVEEIGVERTREAELVGAREETHGERTRSASGTAVPAVEYRNFIRGSVDFQSVERLLKGTLASTGQCVIGSLPCERIGLRVRAGRSVILEVQLWGKGATKDRLCFTVRSWGYISPAKDFLLNKDDDAGIEDKG